MNNLPQVYHVKSDSMADVTQEWCDGMAKSVNNLARVRTIVQKICALHLRDDSAKLDAIAKVLEV